MKVQKLKENKGITLVAVVITIVILLILATISIQTLTQTGLFESANKAKLESKRGQENEPIMWNTLLKQKDLYSTDRFLISKYLSPAPFTAPFTQQSPGQAGRYIGWRIVSEYMRQTGNELPDLWKENNEMNILKTAKYKG